MLRFRQLRRLALFGWLFLGQYAFGDGNGTISSYGTFTVSGSTRAYRWEPSSAAGVSWATSWSESPGGSFPAYLSTWNGGTGSWGTPVPVRSLFNLSVDAGDVFLTWNSTLQRFEFVALDLPSGNSNIWYGYSTDAYGSGWVAGNSGAPVFSATTGNWDYPSIGVDSGGRIIIAARTLSGSSGVFTKVSTNNGASFSGTGQVGTQRGRRFRVIAAGSQFMAFVPVETSQDSGIPTAVNQFISNDGLNWTLNQTFGPFSPPLANSAANLTCTTNPDNSISCSSGCGQSGQPACNTGIFYAVGLDAKGTTTGAWAMAVPMNYGGYNNIMLCTNSRGCGLVNAAADDEFLGGVSVAEDGRFWVSYLAYSTADGSRQLPLIKQSLFFPYSTGGGLGITTDTDVEPWFWLPDLTTPPANTRCQIFCVEMGDYATIASNQYAGASTPYVKQNAATTYTDLDQSFPYDPPGPLPADNFIPNTIWLSPTASWVFGQPVPAYAIGPIQGSQHVPLLPPAPPKAKPVP